MEGEAVFAHEQRRIGIRPMMAFQPFGEDGEDVVFVVAARLIDARDDGDEFCLHRDHQILLGGKRPRERLLSGPGLKDVTCQAVVRRSSALVSA